MKLIRTTLRLKAELKKAAEKLALEKDTTLQQIFNLALEEYLTQVNEKKSGEIVFLSKDMGVPLDNLTRDDFYPDPKF